MLDNENLIVNDWWKKKRKEVLKEIENKLEHRSLMQITDIEKIVLNSGVGSAISDKVFLDKTIEAFNYITYGRKAMITKARKSVTSFKLREGMPLGCKLTLRKKEIWDFLFELININLPSISNFQGFSKKKFDKYGNYNFGIKNLNIFSSVPYGLTNQGIQITIVFKSKLIYENIYFLELLKFPFKK